MDGWITIGTKLDTKKFDAQIQKVERDIADYEQQLEHANEVGFSSRDIEELTINLEKAKNKLTQLNKQKDKLNEKDINLSTIMNEAGKGIESNIKKMGKLALAVFSIRSAYVAVQKASSTLSQYDEQYATNLEYIQYVLAQAIAPVLRYLVKLASTLLSYINYISTAWFGISIFGNASAKAFEKMKKNANGTAKSTKEISKILAGFDEMTVLNQDGSANGIGAITTPTIDATEIQGEVPKWLQWMADNKDTILDLFTQLGIAIGTIKIAELLENLGLLGPMIEKLGLGETILRFVGIGIAIYGVIEFIKQLIEYTKLMDEGLEDSGKGWDTFGKIVSAIGLIIAGVGIVIAGIPAIIAGVVVVIVGIIMSAWDKIKEFLTNAITWLDSKTEWIKRNFGYVGLWIVELFKGVINIVIDLFDGLFTGVKQIFDGIIKIFKGNFKEGIISILKGIVNAIIGVINALISGINAIAYPIRELIAGIGQVVGKNWTVSSVSIPKIPKLATGAIINRPGRGINIGGAVAGEAGKEGILPLTDSQAMQELGEAIGRYITINANITNTMNGRVISRQLQQINQERNFAYNM